MAPSRKTLPTSFASRRAAFLGGMRESASTPALVLGASFLGFGSLCRQSGWTLPMSLFSTTTGWALPGQITLIELYGVGASAAAILLAVWLSGLRLLPMTLSLMPFLRHPGTPRWRYYLAAHFIAITGWANGMQRCPVLSSDQRLPFFMGFGLVLWSFSLVATATGFFMVTWLPPTVGLGLLFLTPVYFLLVFSVDLAQRTRALPLILGAITGPLFHLLSPDWSLLLTGLVAGTVGFLLEKPLARWIEARRAMRATP
ncbi:MAG: AzlC family ABC transporter permease [Hypericibacter sp.]